MLYYYFSTVLGTWCAWHFVLYAYTSIGRLPVSSSALPLTLQNISFLNRRCKKIFITRNNTLPSPHKKWIPFFVKSLLRPSR